MGAPIMSRRIALCLFFILLSLGSGRAQPKPDLVDINHAAIPELKTLPGIADAYANAIAKNRPYANKAQLKSRNVIPPGTYEKIKDKVIAKQ